MLQLCQEYSYIYNIMYNRNEVIITHARIGHPQLTHSFLIYNRTCSRMEHMQGNPLDRHIVFRCPKYTEARTIFNISTSLWLALSKDKNYIKLWSNKLISLNFFAIFNNYIAKKSPQFWCLTMKIIIVVNFPIVLLCSL